MKKSTFLIYAGYIWTKTLVGLTLYPYKYVNRTIRRPILLPVIFSPVIALVFLLIGAKAASWFISVYGVIREIIALILSTTLISLILWQALLIYLLLSFLFALWRNE